LDHSKSSIELPLNCTLLCGTNFSKVRREKSNSCSPDRWDIDFHGFCTNSGTDYKMSTQVFVGWLGIVNFAEAKYKRKHGVYGNLTALRHAHLLDGLVFESNASSQSQPDSNLLPASTGFQVTVSSDGQHYKVAIHERLVDVGNISLLVDQGPPRSTEWIVSRPPQAPPEDGPQGPLPSVAR
jgi:hypothetical protein